MILLLTALPKPLTLREHILRLAITTPIEKIAISTVRDGDPETRNKLG